MKKKRKSFKDEALSDQDEIESVLFLDDLAPEDWAKIKRYADAVQDDKKFEHENLSFQQLQIKSAVAGFCEWLSRLTVPFCVGDRPKKSVH